MLAFTLPLSFLHLGLADKPTCAYVEIARTVPGKLEKTTEWRAPGHCEKVVGPFGAAKSRRFNCYSGCGGTKLQYQEFSDEMCEQPILDKMLHRKMPTEGASTWQTGPQPEDSFLMEFDLGGVLDFDCSLAFCYVMETVEHPVEPHSPKVRHVPADRAACSRTSTGWAWTQCRSDGNLELFESSGCHDTAEPTVLKSADNGSKSVSGVVREWECEGFDFDEEEDDQFSEEVLIKARMTQRAAETQRRAIASKAEKASEEETGGDSDWFTYLIFLSLGSLPIFAFAYRKRYCLKDMLPMPMSTRYAGISQQDDILV